MTCTLCLFDGSKGYISKFKNVIKLSGSSISISRPYQIGRSYIHKVYGFISYLVIIYGYNQLYTLQGLSVISVIKYNVFMELMLDMVTSFVFRDNSVMNINNVIHWHGLIIIKFN